MPTITQCPPMPSFGIAHAAPETVTGKSQMPISATFDAHGEAISPGICGSDYVRMQTITKSTNPHWRVGTPEFARNSARLQEVIVAMVENRAYGCGRNNSARAHMLQERRKIHIRTRLERAQKQLLKQRKSLEKTLDKACAEYVEWTAAGIPRKDLESIIEGLDTQLRLLGNYGAIVGATVYLSYFMNWNSVKVADELGIRPTHVRQLLHRARVAAGEAPRPNRERAHERY